MKNGIRETTYRKGTGNHADYYIVTTTENGKVIRVQEVGTKIQAEILKQKVTDPITPTNKMKTKPGIETGRPWAVKTFSGYAGGSTHEAKVNLIIEGQADEVEDVRAMVDKAINTHADLFQERDRLREVNADLLAACEDAHDFISALAEATAGAGQIDKDSIMRHGERLKTTAKNMAQKLMGVLAKARA